MRDALTIWLALSLGIHIAMHASIAFGLVRRKRYARAAFGFLLSPLGALYGYEAGMKWRARVWALSLAAYAAGVALA